MAQTKTQSDFRPTLLDNSIVDLINNGVIILDDTLKIYAYNKWLQIQTNKQEHAVLSKSITEIFPNINAKVLQRKIKTTLLMQSATYYAASTSGYLIPIKINQIQNSKFEYMQQDVSIVPYDKANRKVALIITDQTGMANTNALLEENILQVKKLNQALLKEKERTQQQHEQLLVSSRNAAMGEMISMIAHQWRQPLSIITTSIATIQVKKGLNILDEKNLYRILDRIERTVVHLSETINDFRDYFKPNKEQTLVHLPTLLNSIDFLQIEMENLNIEYILNIDIEDKILLYKNEFLQVIINLIKNSIDAFQGKTLEHKRIQIDAKKIDKKLQINILDNAGGIEQKILRQIFEPYFSTKSKNGTGLGLYMSQKITQERLHGSLHISSENNQTLATITLPLQEKQK